MFGGLFANLNSLEDLFTKAFLVSCSSETNNSECYMVISIYSQINEVFNQQYKYVSHSHSPRNQPAHVLLEALNLLTNPRHVCSVCSKRKTRRNRSSDKNWTSTKLPLTSHETLMSLGRIHEMLETICSNNSLHHGLHRY